MIDITFNYKVIKIDNDLNMMEVEYSAEGYDTVTVSMPHPFNDVTVEEHFRTYSPMAIWVEARRVHRQIEEGMTGEIAPLIIPLPETYNRANDQTVVTPELPIPTPALSQADVLKMIESFKLPAHG